MSQQGEFENALELAEGEMQKMPCIRHTYTSLDAHLIAYRSSVRASIIPETRPQQVG